jgi:SAM-dependent methyltransferase
MNWRLPEISVSVPTFTTWKTVLRAIDSALGEVDGPIWVHYKRRTESQRQKLRQMALQNVKDSSSSANTSPGLPIRTQYDIESLPFPKPASEERRKRLKEEAMMASQMQAAADKDSGWNATVGPRTPGESKDLVEKGYNQIALRYLEWSSTSTVRVKYVQRLLQRLPEQAEVLELGCGAGVPCTQILAQHAHVTANDISAVQIALAKERVPGARLIQGDMMSLNFDEGRFDAIVALYSIIHLPREEQRLLMKRLAEWLRPGGHLLVNLATVDDAGSVEQNWLGSEMYWSSYDAKTNQEMVREAGFRLFEAEIVCDDEDGKPVSFVWMLATRE